MSCNIYKKTEMKVGQSIQKDKLTQKYVLHTKKGNKDIDVYYTSNSAQLTTENGFIDYLKINYENINYLIGYKEKYITKDVEFYLISYIEIVDAGFITQEGCYVGMKLEEAMQKTNNIPFLAHGWGYYLELKHNWIADFGLSSKNVTQMKQDSVILRFIKSRN